MAKKIKDENGNTYVQKKPIYKRVWFWIVVVILVAIIGNSLGGNKGDKSADSSSTSSSSATSKTASSSSSKKADSNKITRADYDAIKIGDLMDSAASGDTLDALVAKFGKPSSTTSSENNGVKTDVDTWENVEGGFGANLVVSFTSNKAFSKNLTGFKINRKNKIDLAKFNSFANGTTYAAIVKEIGEPDSEDETLIGGEKTVMASYLSGTKGSIGANFSLTFTNDALSGKSQSGLE